ncbi:hypothetical protein [Marinicrinis lubricantis]|uniref:Uncharacterized protein n=1 Tax=Marinicrinis lubricantis TaxID=2086470 RepID=A0ABW1ILX9_9BACL
MNWKVRPVPMMISAVITAVLCFGGWFAYQQFGVKSPFLNTIHQMDGIESADVSFSGSKVVLDLTLQQDASLNAIVQQVKTEQKEALQNKQLELQVHNESSPELDGWWSSVLFDMAQAMDHQAYSEIPAILEKYAGELEGLQASAEIDDNNVYIRLVHGDASKFIILPRTPASMGVWPNE